MNLFQEHFNPKVMLNIQIYANQTSASGLFWSKCGFFINFHIILFLFFNKQIYIFQVQISKNPLLHKKKVDPDVRYEIFIFIVILALSCEKFKLSRIFFFQTLQSVCIHYKISVHFIYRIFISFNIFDAVLFEKKVHNITFFCENNPKLHKKIITVPTNLNYIIL